MASHLAFSIGAIAQLAEYRIVYPVVAGSNPAGLARKQHKGNAMIRIENATVETLDQTQARPTGKTVLSVTIGDHTFDMLVDENELIDALSSQYKVG